MNVLKPQKNKEYEMCYGLNKRNYSRYDKPPRIKDRNKNDIFSIILIDKNSNR